PLAARPTPLPTLTLFPYTTLFRSIGEEGEVHARQVRWAGRDLGSGGFGDEVADAGSDLVMDGVHRVELKSCGVVQLPVLVAFAGEDRAGVATAHRDRRSRGLRGIGGEQRGMVGGSDRAYGEGPASGGALAAVPMTTSKFCGKDQPSVLASWQQL